LLYGAIYGDWIQGVTFRACNFNGRTGGTGILIGGSYTGIPAQLEISGCQFDFGGSSLAIYSNVYDLILHGNLMAAAVNSTPICQVFATSFSIIGNSFYVFDSATSCQGIKVAGGGIGAIGFNRFKDVQVGAAADAGTTAVTVGMNTFANVSTKVINSGGAANAFSLQAYGTMSGVVP
jgi:hypothetical protein